MNRFHFALLVLFIFTLQSCGQKFSPASEENRTSAAPSSAVGGAASQPASESAEDAMPVATVSQTAAAMPKARMIIKTATLALEVEKYDVAVAAVQTLAAQAGGFVQSTNTEIRYESVKTGTTIIRVPSEKFESTLTEIKKLAKKLEQEGLGGSDVTEEFYDVEARLENQKRAEKRYQEILNAAKTVGEILQVENELRRVREDIERIEGRKRFLIDQTGLSTITVNLHEPYPAISAEGGGFWATIGRGFTNGIEGFAAVLGATITFLIAGVPFFAVVAVIIYLFIRWRRRVRSSTPATPKQ